MRPKRRLTRFLPTFPAAFCAIAVALSGCVPPAGVAGASQVPAPPISPSADTSTPADDGGMQPDTFQVVSGLGVNANVHSWNGGELKPAIDRIAELGEVTWRVIIDKADWEAEKNPDGSERIDLEYYQNIYEQGKMADLWATVEYINSKPGQQVMLNVMGGVPDWMGGSQINEGSEDQWVRMIASMVAYGRNVRGLDFKLLGPMNETDWNGIEGPQVSPGQYVRLLRKLIIRLDELGLDDIRLVGPDTASTVKATNDYLPALAADDLVRSRLAHFAIHSYDGDTGGTASALKEAHRLPGDFWVTEFSGPCPGCDSGSPNPTDWASAAATALYAIRLLEQGASGLQQYDAWDGYYEHHQSMGYWGLLAYDPASGTYAPRKSYFVLQQLIKYIPRNALRVAASSSDGSVPVVAFSDTATGRVTFFGHNTTNQAITVTLQAPNIPQTMQLESFATNAAKDMERGDPALLSDGATAYTAPPGAVFTLTGNSTKGTAP
jgi:hypothetical protein